MDLGGISTGLPTMLKVLAPTAQNPTPPAEELDLAGANRMLSGICTHQILTQGAAAESGNRRLPDGTV